VNVDVHAHILMPEVMGRAGEYGPALDLLPDGSRFLRIGPYRAATRMRSIDDIAEMRDPAVRLREMDERGIDVMGITISPLYYLYWATADIAIPFASLQNDVLADFCSEAPDRLFFMCTLPMQDPDAAIAELERAADLGARGVNVGTGGFGGFDLDHERYWPLYDRLQALDLALFLHPYPLVIEEGHADRYNLSWVVGYNFQETEAFAHLTLGGVLDRFPRLRIYITHGGGFVPYQFGRLELASRSGSSTRARRQLRDYLSNFYFDILVHDLGAREFLLEFMGSDNLVVGSNFGGWDAANGFAMLDELDLDAETHRKIAGENARRLFGLTG